MKGEAMKLSECLTAPGQVAVRQSDGAAAIKTAIEDAPMAIFYKSGNRILVRRNLDGYGDDWVRVWPVDEDESRHGENVCCKCNATPTYFHYCGECQQDARPAPHERRQAAKEIAELERRIHELEHPTLGEPLPVGYVIPAWTAYFYENDAGQLQLVKTSYESVHSGSRRRWLDPRPLPKLPLPEPEPRYTVDKVDSSTPWVVKESGVIMGWHCDQADAERIARLLNESEASDEQH